jgi:hypothetical protein
MGLFTTQAARLANWSGQGDDPEWQKLLSEIETKSTPHWVERKLAAQQAELNAERRRREAAQAREDAAEAQLAKEIGGQGQLRRDRDHAIGEAEKFQAELAGLRKALTASEAQIADLKQRLEQKSSPGNAARITGVLLLAGLSVLTGSVAVYFLHSAPILAQLAEVEAAQKAVQQREQRANAISLLIRENSQIDAPASSAYLKLQPGSSKKCAEICYDDSKCKSFDYSFDSKNCYLYERSYSTRTTISGEAGIK